MSMEPRTDKPIFFGTFLLLLAACIPMFLWPKTSEQNIVAMYHWIAENLGIVYQWAVIAIIVLLGWIGLGHHRDVQRGLGVADALDQKLWFGIHATTVPPFCDRFMKRQ